MLCNADVIAWHRSAAHALSTHQSKQNLSVVLAGEGHTPHTAPPSPFTLCEVSDCLAVHGGGGESDGLEGGWTSDGLDGSHRLALIPTPTVRRDGSVCWVCPSTALPE